MTAYKYKDTTNVRDQLCPGRIQDLGAGAQPPHQQP